VTPHPLKAGGVPGDESQMALGANRVLQSIFVHDLLLADAAPAVFLAPFKQIALLTYSEDLTPLRVHLHDERSDLSVAAAALPEERVGHYNVLPK